MIDVDYMHLCERASVDHRNMVTIAGIIDVISYQRVPAAYAGFDVAVKFTGDPHDATDVRVVLARPNGEELISAGGAVSLNETGTMFLNANFRDFEFVDFGPHSVNVFAYGRTLKSRVVDVRRRDPLPGEPPLPPQVAH
jgi:hypothetical protein